MSYNTGQRDVNNGFAGLDATAKIAVAQVPTLIPATNIADGTISDTEFQYLNGVTSDIQTQINALTNVLVPVDKAASYTLLQADTANLIRVTTTAQTMSLPTTPTVGSIFHIKLVNVATCTINVVGGVVTIDGTTSIASTNYDYWAFFFNGTSYDIL